MKSLAALIFILVSATASFAQRQTFRVNPDASEVKMRLNTTHEVVNGVFHVQSGSIEFDRTHPSIAGIVIIAAGSGKTGNDTRDKKMDKDILKVDQFASISFAPKFFSGTLAALGDSTIQVTGLFTLLGTAHEFTVPMQIHIEGPVATVKCQFVVPYVQWGLKNPSFLFWKADNDVTITLNLSGNLSD